MDPFHPDVEVSVPWRERRPAWLPTGSALVAGVLVVALVAVIAVRTLTGDGDDSAAAAGPTEPETELDTDIDDGGTAPETGTETGTDAEPVPPVAAAGDGPVEADGFRRPFVTDGEVLDCASAGGTSVHEVSVRFSGAREIIFDGESFPGRSSDGTHLLTAETPAAESGYLDHVVVLDGAGDPHRVEVAPPVYLPGC